MEEKQALLVVSFGTSHLDTLEKNIKAIEQEISLAMPELALYRAFTSGVIMKKLRTRNQLFIDDVPRAMERICSHGFSRVVVQPTHVINGEEYDKLCRLLEPYRNQIRVSLGKPLLTTVQDYLDTAGAIMASIPAPEPDEAVVFMGHGTAHYANATYALLDYILKDLGWNRAFVGTVEGYPELTQVIARLKQQPEIQKVRLHPLMVVAGDHAKNDMAGEDEESWKNQLQQQGYEVCCCMKGLGEYPAMRKLFAWHGMQAKISETD